MARASERELVEDAIADRRGSGLATDRESIRRAVENSRRADYATPGVFVTPEEEAEEDAIDLRGAGADRCWRGDRQDRLLLAGRSPDDRDHGQA